MRATAHRNDLTGEYVCTITTGDDELILSPRIISENVRQMIAREITNRVMQKIAPIIDRALENIPDGSE